MLKSTHIILEKTETLLSNYTKGKKYDEVMQFPFSKFIYKRFAEPIFFLLIGFKEVCKPVNYICITLFIWFGIIITSGIAFKLSDMVGEVLIYVSLIIVFTINIFSLPSTCSFFGVLPKEIEKVAGFIHELNLNTISEVELLEQNFAYVFQAINNKIKLYRLIIASLWGAYVFFFNAGLGGLLKNVIKFNNWEGIENHIFSLLSAIILTVFALVAAISYKKANDRLMKTIEFACVQVKHDLIK